MASPLLGIAGVNSLLFGAFSVAKRIVSPYPDLSIAQIALAGSMAGAANSVLASPGTYLLCVHGAREKSVGLTDFECVSFSS